jgi:hypothetical protein
VKIEGTSLDKGVEVDALVILPPIESCELDSERVRTLIALAREPFPFGQNPQITNVSRAIACDLSPRCIEELNGIGRDRLTGRDELRPLNKIRSPCWVKNIEKTLAVAIALYQRLKVAVRRALATKLVFPIRNGRIVQNYARIDGDRLLKSMRDHKSRPDNESILMIERSGCDCAPARESLQQKTPTKLSGFPD